MGGVCGGLGRYLAIDPVFVRLFFVILALTDGIGFLLYIVLWVVLPEAESAELEFEGTVSSGAHEIAGKAREMGQEAQQVLVQRDPRIFNWVGGALIFMGAYFLLRNLDLPWLAWLRADLLWPLLLVGAGVFLLIRRGSLGDE